MQLAIASPDPPVSDVPPLGMTMMELGEELFGETWGEAGQPKALHFSPIGGLGQPKALHSAALDSEHPKALQPA